MRIVQVYTEFLPSVGGIELIVYNLAKRLAERGHEVTVMTTNMVGRRPTKIPSEEVVDRIRVLRYPVLPDGLSCRLAIAPSVIPILLRIDADLFHIFSFLPYFLTNVACITSRLRKKPIVLTPIYHPYRSTVYNTVTGKLVKRFYDDLIGNRLLENAQYVIAITEREAQYYREKGIRNVEVVPAAVELNEEYCGPKEMEALRKAFGLDGNVILCVARLERRKGIQYLIRAMRIVSEHFPEAKLLIVGSDWGCKNQLLGLTQKLHLEKSVIFAGYLDFSKLSCAYEIADAVVVPSVFETFSITAIEAWGHKKPIVASKTIGLSDLISPENGILVDYWDYEAMARAVVDLIKDQSFAMSIGSKGYELVKERFTWERIVDLQEKVYLHALNQD